MPGKQARNDGTGMLESTMSILEEKDSFAAIEYLSRQKDSLAAMKTFGELVRHFYWKTKNLPLVVSFGRAGIQFGLTMASQIQDKDSALAYELRSEAKSIAYNVASFTWPGWDEEGIEIALSDLAIGYDAAKTNLRLVIELGKDGLQLSRACWLLGAHHLAMDDLKTGRTMFSDAAKHAEAAKEKGDELLCRTYLFMTDLLSSSIAPDAQRSFDRLKAELASAKDGEAYVQQIDTAWRVFSSDSRRARK